MASTQLTFINYMRNAKEAHFRIAVLALILLVWQLVVWWIAPPNLPGIVAVLESIAWHSQHGELIENTLITLLRVTVAFTLAMLFGCIIGMLMGANRWFNLVADSVLIIFLNVPALVLIILSYIWIGLVETAAILAVVLNKIPTVVVSVREGARMVDNNLIEVAKVYRVSWARFFTHVYLPQLAPYIMSAARNGLSLIWKIVLVVELLGRSDGVGFALHSLFQFFDIAGIIAYTVVFIAVIFVVEALLFRPLDKIIARGRQPR